MNEIKNKVIIWSCDNFNTLGLMRELGIYNFDLFFLIKGKASFAAYSKYCCDYQETDSLTAGLDYLKANFKVSTDNKNILITSGDDIAVFLDDHRDELKDSFILPVTRKKGNLKKYTDKYNMTVLAEKTGINCPKTYQIKWNSPIPDISFPCVIKPSHENVGHYNEFKIKICKNKKQLSKVLSLVRHDSIFVLQEYVPKETDILIYGCRMWDESVVLAGTFYKDRFDGVGSGSHGFLEKEIHKSIDIKKIEELLHEIDYFGLFSIEFGLYKDKAYFYEINLRNDGTSDYFCQAGANLPAAYVFNCAAMDWRTVPHEIKKKSWFIDELFDIENVLIGSISLKQWKEDSKQATINKYYNEEDVEPYNRIKKMRLKILVSDLLLKRFRIYIVYFLDRLGLHK